MELPSRVKLREVAPRDGFQSLRDFVPTEQKLQIIEAIIKAGIKEIESTSFVSPKGSLKNNFTFWHLIFRLSLYDPHSQSPRNSSLFLWLYSIGSHKSNLNLSANSAKLFLSEP